MSLTYMALAHISLPHGVSLALRDLGRPDRVQHYRRHRPFIARPSSSPYTRQRFFSALDAMNISTL